MWKWLEPEEQVGRYWHQLTGRGGVCSYPEYPAEAVTLESVHTSLRTFFHGLGGDHGLPLTAGMPKAAHHRMSWKQRLNRDIEKLPLATFDPERLLLPATISFFPRKSLNRQLYFWLAAFFARAEKSALSTNDPFQADLLFLHRAYHTSLAICRHYPGLEKTYRELCEGVLQSRLLRSLPKQEQAVESAILALLKNPYPDPSGNDLLTNILHSRPDFGKLQAVKGYRSFLPVPLWGAIETTTLRNNPAAVSCDADTRHAKRSAEQTDNRRRKARHGKFDQSRRNDPLLLNRFEKLITWAEMIDVNRTVEDEDETTAREVAESMDELAITSHQRRASTILKFDLDLSPADVDPAGILAELTCPEWDYRRRQYHAAHCRVLCRIADETGARWEPGAEAIRQFRRIRRQFEALRPGKEILRRQVEGTELDLDAVVRACSDQAGNGGNSDRLYLAERRQIRDLAVTILVDVSLSTDSWINNRRILDIEKEALIALATGMAACRDTFSIVSFTSRKRHFVQLTTLKSFDSLFSSQTLRRIAALRPGYYTRMGAALRHVSQLLAQRPERHRLLLLLSDGKPNDLDHYEGRYGIEDTRQAVMEARRLGLKLFGITIDREAKDYFPYLFGRGNYAIINRPERLIEIVPTLYRQLTS